MTITTSRPPAPGSLSPVTKAWTGALRLVLLVLVLTLVAAPFAIAFRYEFLARQVSAQLDVPAATLSPSLRAALHAAAPALDSSAPIVLAYHDIARDARGRYAITPTAFEEQMAMLHAAGYHTLSSAEVLRYVAGGPVPKRSAVITFDDGPHGVWTYADKVLQRYGFQGIVFVITGRVGTHRPYYLSWQEITRMQRSGRWSFESHTRSLHSQVPVDGKGTLQSDLTARRWLNGHVESWAHFTARVHGDLLGSINDLKSHGLPAPRMFAYPFSEASDPAVDVRSADYAVRQVRQLFAVSMTNPGAAPLPMSRREIQGRVIDRLELFNGASTLSMLRRMVAMTLLPDGDAPGLGDPNYWLSHSGRPAQVSVKPSALSFAVGDTWAYAAYAPQRTPEWSHYRVSTVVRSPSGSATVTVGVGGAQPTAVRVSQREVDVLVGHVVQQTLLRSVLLPASPQHLLVVRMAHGRVSVSVDGRWIYTRTLDPSATTSGGFALSAFRRDLAHPFSAFTALHVSAVR